MKSTYKKYVTTAALVWSGCFLLFLFIYMLVLAPQKKSQKLIEKQLAEKQQIYNSAQKATQEETKIKLNKQIERLRNKMKDVAIDFEDSANLTFDISQIANEKNVSSFKIGTKYNRGSTAIPNCSHIYENPIGISFTSGFNQFATLLNALERHRPIIFVDKFTITRSEQDNSGHQVTMNLSVFVRKRKDS